MKKINKLLRTLDIKPIHYEKKGNALMVTTKDHKYVIKKNSNPIYDYLNQRTFHYYPNTRMVEDYEVADYIEESMIPNDQKILDMTSLIALLHVKTTHYKSIEEYGYQDIYETIKGNLEYLKSQYDEAMDRIESEIFMSPSSYLLARHITSIYNMIKFCSDSIETWYNKVKEEKKIRLVILHNNLSLEHFFNDKLISWNKAKIGPPIFDLYKFYKNTYTPFVWEEIMKNYLAGYPLKEEELELFYIMISMPTPLEFTQSEYKNVKLIHKQLDYMNRTNHFIEEMKKTST